MLEILGGIAIAAFVFAALLWSIYRAVTTAGHLRMVHLLLAINTILGMQALSFGSPIFGQFVGGGLVVIGTFALWYDDGWSKLLPLVQILFGGVLIVGLPWLIA